jgi:hypothetical protein
MFNSGLAMRPYLLPLHRGEEPEIRMSGIHAKVGLLPRCEPRYILEVQVEKVYHGATE